MLSHLKMASNSSGARRGGNAKQLLRLRTMLRHSMLHDGILRHIRCHSWSAGSRDRSFGTVGTCTSGSRDILMFIYGGTWHGLTSCSRTDSLTHTINAIAFIHQNPAIAFPDVTVSWLLRSVPQFCEKSNSHTVLDPCLLRSRSSAFMHSTLRLVRRGRTRKERGSTPPERRMGSQASPLHWHIENVYNGAAPVPSLGRCTYHRRVSIHVFRKS